MSYIGNPINSVAFLTDQFSGNGSTTAFTMSVAPATTSSVLVSISGVLQDPTTYSVASSTLTFSAAPPAGTGNISVRYLGVPASGVTTTAYRTVTEFTATAGQTSFSTPSYTVGFINVYQNGVRLGAADFTATNGTTVVLATGAAAGDLVTTESFYVSSVLNAIPATAGSVQQTYFAPNVAGNGPAFSAQVGTSQTGLTTATSYKTALTNELFDTASCFNNTGSTVGGIPSYSFMPNVAGYYLVVFQIYITPDTAAISAIEPLVYKNGSTYLSGPFISGASTTLGLIQSITALVYLNGSTDYLSFYSYGSTTSGTFTVSSGAPSFASAVLMRAA